MDLFLEQPINVIIKLDVYIHVSEYLFTIYHCEYLPRVVMTGVTLQNLPQTATDLRLQDPSTVLQHKRQRRLLKFSDMLFSAQINA